MDIEYRTGSDIHCLDNGINIGMGIVKPYLHLSFSHTLKNVSSFDKCVAIEQVVNLIPFNPISGDKSTHFKSTPKEAVLGFQKILRGAYNIRTTVRQQMGQDISGACGQLVVNLQRDIEDLRI